MKQQEVVFGNKTTADNMKGVTEETRQDLCNIKSISRKWVFVPQWSDCPVEVEKEVKKLWDRYDLSEYEDYYHVIGGEYDEYPLISEWCRRNGVPEDEIVIIKYWS